MPRIFAVAVLLLAACSPAGDKPAATADSTAAEPAAAAASAVPQAILTVIYNPPKDAKAFEAYYPKHLAIVSEGQPEIGFTKAELTKFESTLDGKKPTFYRQAELYFDSMEALKRGIATPAFKKAGDDIANFASGGALVMIATETGEKGTAACPALVTVIYEHPKGHAHDEFEKYYADTHLPLVVANAAEIGFTRADLTKFETNLDGNLAARYRQAELCFDSMDALKKGVATPGFKKVGDDLGNFATGGLAALIGTQQ
jgi:uncharacterized protein (TIGR02118 family)